jgi:hypothetical protein
MKKRSKKSSGVRQEYDFAKIKGGVRGKYAKRSRAGTNLVLLDSEIYRAFPTDSARCAEHRKLGWPSVDEQ